MILICFLRSSSCSSTKLRFGQSIYGDEYPAVQLSPKILDVQRLDPSSAFDKWQQMKQQNTAGKKSAQIFKKNNSTTINERIAAMAARGLLCREMLFNDGSDD